MLKWLSISFISLFALIHPLTIKEKIEHSPAGVYTVFEQNGSINILLVKEHIPSYLILEEITASKKKAPKTGMYKKWIEQGAPGHTSWVSYMVNTTTGTIEEVYSYTQEKWYSPHNADALFGTLLALTFEEVPPENQRKIGPTPPSNELDQRKVWTPPLIREGKKQPNRSFEILRAHWPKDGSDLSDKEVEVYLDKQDATFPFPYWIQVNDTAISYKLRALDSGYGAVSPYPQTPLRPLKLASPLKKEGDTLHISLFAQEYHLPLKIELIDARSGKRYSIENPTLTRPTPSILSLVFSKDSLKKQAPDGDLYQLTITPEGKHPSLSYTTSSFKL